MELVLGTLMELWSDGLYTTVALSVFLVSAGFVIYLIWACIYIILVKRKERRLRLPRR